MPDALERNPGRADELILVDGLDRQVGTATKERAHREGLLHRAFSVVLVREGREGIELLLAQRARGKYHSGGLWANSCCSHPRAGEELLEAVARRVREELGCGVSDLAEVGCFIYRAEFEGGLVEYEYDHVLIGAMEGELVPDGYEVADLRWETVEAVAHELVTDSRHFCAWAYTVLSLALARLNEDRGLGMRSS